MRKVSIVAAAAAVLLAIAFPARADGDSDVVACLSSGGYSGSTWSLTSANPGGQLPLSAPCAVASSDINFTVPVPQLNVPPAQPPAPSVDPTSPTGTVFSILNSVCTPEPSLCSSAIQLLPTFWSPAVPDFVQLDGTGNFKCGNGTLSGTGYIQTAVVAEPDFSVQWSATFTNGVGTVTGTATADGWENGAESGQVKTLGGQIIVNDGAPAQCDDSAGNSQVVALLTINP